MQEEVNEKTISLCIKGGKITAQILKAALIKLLAEMDKKKQRGKGEKSQCKKTGRQSIKSLQKSGAQITNIVVTDNNIKSFDRVARKHGMRGSNLDSARSIKMKENSILFRIQEAEERRLRLYEDYKAEILDEDEYSQLKEHYIAEKQRLEHELQKQRQRALELEKRIKICDAQMERMRGILNQNEFDEELVHELIKRIYVGMDNSVEVEFKCSDPYQEVLAIMSEVQNE